MYKLNHFITLYFLVLDVFILSFVVSDKMLLGSCMLYIRNLNALFCVIHLMLDAEMLTFS